MRGVPTAAPRSPAARELLDLRWNYPVHVAAAAAPARHGTDVEARREALPRERALELLAADDPRPLLVLRECLVCNKTDDALLSKNESNERTLILARFFRCVRLPVDVNQADHPFHTVFPRADAEHLYVSARDGTARIPLESDTSRVELWAAMESTLAHAYGLDAGRVVKQVLAGLDKVDECERKVTDLETRKGQLMETPRVDVSKVKKLDADLELAKQAAATARAAVAKLFAVEPRAPASAGIAR
jgi:hypothetical protein